MGRAVIGIHAVREAIKVRPRDISTIWLKKGWEESHDLRAFEELAKKNKITLEEKSVGQLNQVAESHQGLVAYVLSQPEFSWDELKGDTQRLVFLDQVEDPHNLGAVLRTAWLLGAQGVFVPDIRSASLSPAASKVAQGAAEHVPVVQAPLQESMNEAKERGFWIFGLSHRSSKTVFDLKLPEKVAWVLGSEASGIRKPIERLCDELVAIPQLEADASFNVSVAAAIALSETFRQHQITEKSGK
jgi:23S rRNA (guanosine2251-2'-O)-methyltransferase